MSTSVAVPHGLGEPSRWVRDWAHLVAPGGAVLDVASGAGRHARFFASRGHPVTAVDRDAAALELLRDAPHVSPLVADLENAPWPLPGDAAFAAIVVTNYLHRPLFPQLLHALAPGGVLVYETFAQGNESVGKPFNPAFLLAPGELLERVRGQLRVVAYQDGFLAQPRPAYIQRICAIREAAGSNNPEQTAFPPCYELAG
ncbi:class I SAM-dependent methyltransferase [Paraburkholderia sp. MMS20-SJTR3]|uniref:Class I SAM-dependent methyltransferase n=1 Tax=Paraburkholderia sejongensis TaxID=2886946 RepID=A0ABS8JXD8_9BURK|nr:class I SAM-dependent methyltransferase [Paraburkholderia sp. MMS20-SJTR3]MCC8394410.1 class I SAM-dependent methyltransferase [Paraburkholderia sp. MMS20-SJTR3]